MSQETIPQGNRPHGDTDDGAPVKIGGVARTTNPTAVADADRVNASFDKIGRQINYPYTVRDLVSTGYSALTRITETAIITGVASTFLDVVSVTGANTTGVAATVDLRLGTASGVIDTISIPANSVTTKQYAVPIPMPELAAAVTAQWTNTTGEISDSPISVQMIAIRNI